MSIASRILFVAFGSALLAGCGDGALVGTWEGSHDSSVDLEVEEASNGYEGEGHIHLCSGSDCFLCPFDFEAKESGDERWDLEGRFTGECSSQGELDGIECRLARDGEELRCDLPGGGTIDYEKQD